MKTGIFELTKCRSSDLKEALPRFNRAETKKNMEKEVLSKVGLVARLQLQLQDLEDASAVMDSLLKAKTGLEEKYKAFGLCIVLPSSYMSWLEKRPWLLQAICFGSSTPQDRELSSTLQNGDVGYTGGLDTLKTRLCLACLTGQTVLTRAMQKNKKIGTQFPATLDVLMSFLKDDLKKVRFKLDGISSRKLCYMGLAGDQKWFQQILHLPVPQTGTSFFSMLVHPWLSPRHWKGNGEANGNRPGHALVRL
ncbi:unnamed protein product [Symbiodinium sp. CCMP2592]|nr:unnamed protein product [Symbiodinium sp. CCMP2592]